VLDPKLKELPVSEKLDYVFDYLKTLGWDTATFLCYLFAPRNRNHPCSSRHGGIVERFLNGRCEISVSQILEAWWTTADGCGINSDEMYSVEIPYIQVRPVRAAMLSFTAQIIEAKLVDEAQRAIQETSGLHASVADETDNGSVQWANSGATLIPTVKIAFQTHQPLAFHYMHKITEPKPRTKNGVIAVHTYRPPELVSQMYYL
jgi:hypothetical protein